MTHATLQTELTAHLGKFFIATVYKSFSVFALIKKKKVNASPKLKPFLQEHIGQGSH